MVLPRLRGILYPLFNCAHLLQQNGSSRRTISTSVCHCRSYQTQQEREDRRKKHLFNRKKTLENKIVFNFLENMTIAEVAAGCGIATNKILNQFNNSGLFRSELSEHSTIDDITKVEEILEPLGYRVIPTPRPKKIKPVKMVDLFRRPPPVDKLNLINRPPVVTVMGHVDHGKTTLLDALRDTSVAQSEIGGITQAIGSFTVKLSSGVVTFIDTPGHAAFSNMRERGTQVTDIVILVVAADDGVMPQTIESIKLAQAANVSIIVAVNKCDLKKIDPDAVLEELKEHGVVVEKFGGDVQHATISALKKKGLDQLLECIITQFGIMEIKADPTGPVEGVILETGQEKGRGFVASVIVQQGTLKKRQYLVAGTSWACVQSLLNENGKQEQCTLPGYPVKICGWKSMPETGQVFLEAKNKAHAMAVIQSRKNEDFKIKKLNLLMDTNSKRIEASRQHVELLKERIITGVKLADVQKKGFINATKYNHRVDGIPELCVVVKTDVHGSLDTILRVISMYNDKRCKFNVVSSGVGSITDNDLSAAELSGGIIYLFNLEATKEMQYKATTAKVEIIQHKIIYNIFNDMRERLWDLVPVDTINDVRGEATVLSTFPFNNQEHVVAGCKLHKGVFKKNLLYRVMRDSEVVKIDHLSSLRFKKNEVDTIKNGSECGLIFDTEFTFEEGDTIQAITSKKVKMPLNWQLPGEQK